MDQAPITSAHVDIATPDNVTFNDAYEFGVSTDTSWNFTGKTFRMDIKANSEASAALLSLTSAGGQIVVDDVTLRVLHFLVPFATLTAAMPPGEYVYDFVMTDGSSIRTALMHGSFTLTHGVTG